MWPGVALLGLSRHIVTWTLIFQLLQIDTAGCLEVVQERKGLPTLTHKVSVPPPHLLTCFPSWHGAPRALGRSLMSTGV